MKKVCPLLIAALLLAGCAHRYDMVLTNGIKVTNVTKPVLNTESGQYTYKDVAGNQRRVSQSRVLEIMPHSHRNDVDSSTGR
ncbi:MAG TPA: YgdI/YgdR family lipoprotein [Candidatus Baltobacteraceae bacterium]|nr:YgdI/YgdR family lipoprotein [Candidatus Baltobacteraceae bacterium]